MRTIVVGIDPGATGALCFIDTADWTIEVFDMPSFWIEVNGKRRRVVDKEALASLVHSRRPRLLSTEKVHSMPDQSAQSVFTFGRFYGQIEMLSVMSGAEFLETDPAVWKRQMGVSADKDFSIFRAKQLVPASSVYLTRKKDHDRSEAILLALFGVFNLGLIPKKITLKEGEDNADRRVA